MSDLSSLPTQRVSRRTLAKGVAWSVPAVVVASATPAFASSCGATQFVTYGTTVQSPTRAGYALQVTQDGGTSPEGVPVKDPSTSTCGTTNFAIGQWPLTVAGTVNGSVSYRAGKYVTSSMKYINDCNQGTANGNWDIFSFLRNPSTDWPMITGFPNTTAGNTFLMLGQDSVTNLNQPNAWISQYTFTANQAMSNVTLYLTDVDSGSINGQAYQDTVWISSNKSFSGTASAGSSIVGNGTQATPWYNNANVSVGTTSNLDIIQVTFPSLAAGDTFTINYSSMASGSTKAWQWIGISPIRFTVPC